MVFWKFIPLLPVATFSMSAIGVLSGDFDGSGLPEAVLPLHGWVNAFEAGGWGLVLALSVRHHSRLASSLAVFLAGMWFWDMVTTLPLSMPMPPLQIIWGPLSVFAMLLLAYQLRLDGGPIGNKEKEV